MKRSRCSYCHKRIKSNTEVFGMGAKAHRGIDLKNQEGMILDLDLLDGRKIYAMVVTKDSEAKRDGYDFVFMTCSETCAKALKNALEQDKRLIEKGSLS